MRLTASVHGSVKVGAVGQFSVGVNTSAALNAFVLEQSNLGWHHVADTQLTIPSMHKLLLVLASVASLNVMAAPGLNLSPMPGEKKIDVVKTENFTGSCGSAIVRVLGVENFIDDTLFRMELDGGKLIVRGTGKELELTPMNGLDTLVGLSCVPTKAGNRLLVWTNCGGNGCPFFNFTVIDPVKAMIVAPKNPAKETCDEKCATTSLGRKLPVSLSL